MATAREAHMKSMARLMELGRMHLDGKTVKQIAEHYNFSPSYARLLVEQFECLTTAKNIGNMLKGGTKMSRYMAKEEAKELEHIRDWLEFLAAVNIDAPKSN